MDEEDIEFWYEESKQKLSDIYIKNIASGANEDERTQKFNKEMSKLNAEYERKNSALNRKKERKEKREKTLHTIASPFVAIKNFFASTAIFIGSGISKAFSDRYDQIRFKSDMSRIRKDHKTRDKLANKLRPSYYFYANHLKLPLLIIASPFVKIGRFFGKRAIAVWEKVMKAWAFIKKYSIIVAKFTAKNATACQKKILSRLGVVGKKYQDWQTRRSQARIDKKQKQKEEKEKKLKEKEEKKKAKPEEKPGEKPGQKPGDINSGDAKSGDIKPGEAQPVQDKKTEQNAA